MLTPTIFIPVLITFDIAFKKIILSSDIFLLSSINLLFFKDVGVFSSQWGLVLAGFDIIYLILSTLLFEEFVD